jgi:hypothetical protein
MYEMMEAIFEAVCEEYGMAWYEVFDGDLMEVVMERIEEATGMDEEAVIDSEWYQEMAGDL